MFSRRAFVTLFLAAALTGASSSSEIPRDPPFALPPTQELEKLTTALLRTEKGDILIELFPKQAPWHVANFKYLADKGYYRGISFHLHYADYIIQGGDPTGGGQGGPGYSLPPEFNSIRHVSGTVGMARISGLNNPERRSNGGQFHILMRENGAMDRNYTAFGKVVRGMSVVKKLRKGDRIVDLVVYVQERQ